MSESASYFTDQTHLTAVSYQNQRRLQTRIETHRRYSQPRIDLIVWALAQISWRGDERVVDVGCGSGAYLTGAQAHGRAYIAGDLSFGMLTELPANTVRVQLDAQALPLAAHTADVVFANHMLYHVPDQLTALHQIKRILQPNGVLLATTNSAESRHELTDLVRQALADLGVTSIPFELGGSTRFTLEEGENTLQQVFGHVTRHALDSAFVFPEAAPVVAYVASGFDWLRVTDNNGRVVDWPLIEEAIYQRLDHHFTTHDTFSVNKKAGVFICRP